jgi:AraC-like DNA-binding protein
VSSRASGRRIEARTFAPSKDLADVIGAHWVGRWDLRDQAPHTTELLGDPCAHVVFERSDQRHESRLVGVWTRLWLRTLEGRGQVRGVKLRAGAIAAFFEPPAHRFERRIVPLASVTGLSDRALARLEMSVLDPEDDVAAFAAVETWLRTCRRPDTTGHISLAVALVDRIATHPEITTMQRLAAESGLGIRALQRLFRDHVGASPKWVIRRNRLQEVVVRIERGDTISLAALAADLGYTDQAHLARDFKDAVGKSPSAFAASLEK